LKKFWLFNDALVQRDLPNHCLGFSEPLKMVHVKLRPWLASLMLCGASFCSDLYAELETPSQRQKRFELMDKALEGDIDSMMQLGKRYLLEGDKVLAAKWFRDAADLKHLPALWQLVGIKERAPLAKRAEEMKSLYEELMTYGIAQAYYRLGRLYQWKGHHLHDVTLGDLYLKDAAKMGSTPAKLLLGKLYMGEWNHPKDFLQAVDYFTQASKDKNGEAFRSLGLMYRYGVGVKVDLNLAWKYYGEGARNGDVESMFVIAEALFQGDDIEQDKPRSHRYYFQAAKLGHHEAGRQLKNLDFGDSRSKQLLQ
jgi:TPR repeat protein